MYATDGGDGQVTSSYTVLDQYPDIMVSGSNTVIDAETIVARDDEFGIEFTFTIPLAQYKRDGPKVDAADRASWLQTMAKHDHVEDIRVAKDLNNRNLLTDMVFITVGGAPAAGTTEVEWPLNTLNTPGAFQAVDDAYNRLLAVTQGTF